MEKNKVDLQRLFCKVEPRIERIKIEISFSDKEIKSALGFTNKPVFI